MNKTKKILVSILLMLITIGINTFSMAGFRGNFNLGEVHSYSVGDVVNINSDIFYHGANGNMYCVEHHQRQNSILVPYTFVSKVNITGNVSTDYTGKSVTSKNNARLLGIFINSSNHDIVKNSVWNYMYTWVNTVGVNHSGIDSNFALNVPGVPVILDQQAAAYAETVGNVDAKISDKTDKDKIKTATETIDGNTYIKVGPFKWQFSGNLSGIKTYDGNKKEIGNAKYAVYEGKTLKITDINGIKTNKDFYAMIPANSNVEKISRIKGTIDVTSDSVDIWFFKSALAEYQNYIYVEPSRKTNKIETDLDYDIPLLANLKIKKVDKDNKKKVLKDVGFVVQRNSDSKYLKKDSKGKISYVDKKDATEFITDSKGEILIKDLLVGKYTVYETKNINSGYIVDKTPKEVDVKINSTGTVTFEITNEQVFSDLKIIKVNEEDTSIKLENVSFKIQYKEDSKYVKRDSQGKITYVDEKDATEFKTDKNGEILIKDLLIGKYGVVETKNENYGYVVDGKEKIVDVKANKEGLVTYTKTNKQKYIKLSGYVWLDKKPEQKDSTELPNGLYKEDGFDINDELIKDIPVRLMYKGNKEAETKTDANGAYLFDNVEIEKLADYYIEFEYDGLKYENVAVNLKKDNGSKASEGEETRKAFNEGFYAIEGTGESTGVAKGADGTVKHNIEYTKNKEAHTAELKNTDNITIQANTANAKYNIKDYRVIGENEIKNINLGIQERKEADLTIIKDLVNAKATINGYEHTYKYGKAMRAKEDETYSGEGFNVAVRFGTGDINKTYTRAIYPSDVNYTNSGEPDRELKVYITYKLGLKNKTTDLKAKVYNIADYYDARYTLVKAGATLDENNGNITSELTPNQENSAIEAGKYKKAIINTEGVNIEEGSTSYIYVQFQLSREAILAIMDKDKNGTVEIEENNEELLENVVEINSYGSYDKNGNVYAAIDKNSNPGNIIPGDISTYEDDTDIAPALKLETTDSRKISGTAFIDEAEIRNGTKEGDGELTDKDKGRLKNIPVTLKSNNSELTYTANTDENGEFTISGFIPGDYTITYSWGNKDYNVEIYKSTIFRNPERANNKDWFKDENPRYSDAMDDWETRKGIDNGSISNVQGTDYKTIDATTPLMGLPIETDPKAALTTESLGDKYVYAVNNVDFGIVERPEQKIEVKKNVKEVKITLPNDEVLTDATVDDNGNLVGQVKGITKYGDEIKVEIDNELIQGSTAEIKYAIVAENISDIDYYSEDFYKYGYEYANAKGSLNDDNIVKIKVGKVLDYLDETLVYKDGGWSETTEGENKDGRIKFAAESDKMLKPSEKIETLTLGASKLLSINGKLDFDNTAKVNEPKSGILEVIYGRQPKEATGDAERIVITNATGENREYILPISIGIGTLATVGLVIIIWKRKKTSDK